MASKTQIQELLTLHKIVDEKIVQDFLGLAGTNGAAQRRTPSIMVKDVEYLWCRNSGHYFLLEDMVKDKNGKSKGYSSIGNSIYNQAQNHKKKLLAEADVVKDSIINLKSESKTFKADNKELRAKLVTLEQSIEDGLFSDGPWMVRTFLGNLKPERQELFNKIAHTKESLEA